MKLDIICQHLPNLQQYLPSDFSFAQESSQMVEALKIE